MKPLRYHVALLSVSQQASVPIGPATGRTANPRPLASTARNTRPNSTMAAIGRMNPMATTMISSGPSSS